LAKPHICQVWTKSVLNWNKLRFYGESTYGNFSISLPILWGSPYGNGDPLMENIPIWEFLPQSLN
jgi:hypothetical protein